MVFENAAGTEFEFEPQLVQQKPNQSTGKYSDTIKQLFSKSMFNRSEEEEEMGNDGNNLPLDTDENILQTHAPDDIDACAQRNFFHSRRGPGSSRLLPG